MGIIILNMAIICHIIDEYLFYEIPYKLLNRAINDVWTIYTSK